MRLGNAELTALLVRRLGRLVRLKRTLDGAAPVAQHRLDLVHAATRSTLVDLARLGRADLAVAILARGRRGRPRRPAGHGILDVWKRR
jgi:hypothetical protein